MRTACVCENSGAVQDILISNVTGVSEAGVVLVGHDAHPIERMHLHGMNLRLGNLTEFLGGYRDLRPGPADIEEAQVAALYARNIQELIVSVRAALPAFRLAVFLSYQNFHKLEIQYKSSRSVSRSKTVAMVQSLLSESKQSSRYNVLWLCGTGFSIQGAWWRRAAL